MLFDQTLDIAGVLGRFGNKFGVNAFQGELRAIGRELPVKIKVFAAPGFEFLHAEKNVVGEVRMEGAIDVVVHGDDVSGIIQLTHMHHVLLGSVLVHAHPIAQQAFINLACGFCREWKVEITTTDQQAEEGKKPGKEEFGFHGIKEA